MISICCCCWNSGWHTQSFRPDAWFHYSSIQTCPVSQETLPPVPVSPGTAARPGQDTACPRKSIRRVFPHTVAALGTAEPKNLCKISQYKSLSCLCTLALSGGRHSYRQVCAHATLKGAKLPRERQGALVYQQEFGLPQCGTEEKL